MDAERFLLKWNNHQSNLVTVFDQLYEQEAFTDVTLACDGKSFAAHKVILSACSPYFQQLFLKNPCQHPIIFMRDVRAPDLDSLLAFMYRGEINVHQQDLPSFLKTAESLQIKGLSDASDKPRDSSKILEAVEKKFSSSSGSSSPLRVTTPAGTGTNITLNSTEIANSSTSTKNSHPKISNSSTFNMLNRTFLQHLNNNQSIRDHSSGPPSKKFKPLTQDFSHLFPQIKQLVSHSSSLISPIPGLITTNSLAANAIKSVAVTRPISFPFQSGDISRENNNSPSYILDGTPAIKEERKDIDDDDENEPTENDDKNDDSGNNLASGDTPPHPMFMVSNMSGYGSLNSSGKSTPHDIKIEEEDPFNEKTDDQINQLGLNSLDGLNFNSNDPTTLDRLSYPCRFCGKRFTQTGTCRRHERLHTAPNSFKCPFCQKGFNRKYRLKEHILGSHPEATSDKDLTVLINNSDTSVLQ